jgi:CRP-like cAMP-binding protein
LAEAAFRTLGGHLQDVLARLREVTATRVQRRIASALLRLLRSSGQQTGAGLQIAFPITRQDIAEMAATTLYTVSRTFSSWENAGVLAVGRRRVVVVNPQALMRLAGEDCRETRTSSGSVACTATEKALYT